MAMSQFVASEVKAHKTNKEKLKAVLVIIDSIDDEELGEVGSVPKPSQFPSPQTNLGTYDSSLLLCSGSLINSPMSYSSNNDSQHSSSPGPNISSDVTDLANSVLTWNSNEDFCNFCSKIGLSFNSWAEVENFLNLVRSQ